MAAYTGALGEELCATGDEVALWDRRLAGGSAGIEGSRRFLLSAHPAIKAVLGVDIYIEVHVCVLRATELGTFTGEYLASRVHVSLEQQLVVVTRDNIGLA